MVDIKNLLNSPDIGRNKGQISLLSSKALENGLHDKYDHETKKRFIVSPTPLLVEGIIPVEHIVIPKFLEVTNVEDKNYHIYEVPVNLVAKEMISLETTSQHIVFWDPKTILKNFQDANPKINPQFISDEYWAVGNGTDILVPIFFTSK